MALSIIGHNNVYNLYCSISDYPYFVSGLTLELLTKFIEDEYGKEGLSKLKDRLTRVHKKGTSSYISSSLEDEVCIFLEEHEMTIEKFISIYLTIKEEK